MFLLNLRSGSHTAAEPEPPVPVARPPDVPESNNGWLLRATAVLAPCWHTGAFTGLRPQRGSGTPISSYNTESLYCF
jgi:hypothetical protein